MGTEVLLELQYLGNVQYYTKYLKYSKIYLEQHENYRKGSFRNRCCIATANGVISLSIPLLRGKHQQANIRSVGIDNSQAWQQLHWKSIKTAYGGSPFFEYYQDDFASFYTQKYDRLFDFCLDLQELILNSLQLMPIVELTDQFIKDTAGHPVDFRNKTLPKNYLDTGDTTFNPSYYPQVFEDRHGFLPNLSILDLLFCTGPEAIAYLQMSMV